MGAALGPGGERSGGKRRGAGERAGAGGEGGGGRAEGYKRAQTIILGTETSHTLFLRDAALPTATERYRGWGVGPSDIQGATAAEFRKELNLPLAASLSRQLNELAIFPSEKFWNYEGNVFV